MRWWSLVQILHYSVPLAQAKLHAMMGAAFQSGDEAMQEKLQHALGVSKNELVRLYDAGQKMSEAIANGNHAAVTTAESELRQLYGEVRKSRCRFTIHFRGSYEFYSPIPIKWS